MNVNGIPTVLLPLFLRSGWRYRSLRKHSFTWEDKIWITKNLVDFSGDGNNDLESAIKAFCCRYDLSYNIIVTWLNTLPNHDGFEIAIDALC